MSTAAQVRASVVERLRRDLVGPHDPTCPAEVLSDYPTDKYLTGILYPLESALPQEEDDSMDSGGEDESDDGGVPLMNCRRPASAGLSFIVSDGDGIRCSVRGARYVRRWLSADGKTLEENENAGGRAVLRWLRVEPPPATVPVDLRAQQPMTLPLAQHGFPGLELYVQILPVEGGANAVTAVLVNKNRAGDRRETAEERAWFQVGLEVSATAPAILAGRLLRRAGSDQDDRTAELIYRDAAEFAVGHTCSAAWTAGPHRTATKVRTEWVPSSIVHQVSFDGDAVFDAVRSDPRLRAFSATWLGQAAPAELLAALERIPEAYEKWMKAQHEEARSLEPALKAVADIHEGLWKMGAGRMRSAINTMKSDGPLLRAFQLANLAMAQQRIWANPEETDLVWRPFQIAFLLMTMESVVNSSHSDRDVMDLLWFPTGGGKTEAYLGAIALVLFHRRLAAQGGAAGAGVSVIMRYTLRVLTTQQFDRAARLVMACERLRADVPRDLGTDPFSIGLWVGGSAIPNKVDAAHRDTAQRAFQIKSCPACSEKLVLGSSRTSYEVRCVNRSCHFGKSGQPVPLWTVDQDIYVRLPSLLIGTVDKFVQIARNANTGRLFGLGTPHDAPDLIIQDELHLISGPLGTMTGLYETAIDAFCAHKKGARPKVIGSTATIKMAGRQVRDLFNRELYQFPPPGLDARNSCFAVTGDDPARARLYLGVTTAGRSAKFALQAACASLLQSAGSPDVPAEHRDDYWTLVAYFNSLRELGGAHVLLLDDVPKSMAEYAGRRGEPVIRRNLEQTELTSRLSQAEIPDTLRRLERKAPDSAALDAVLSTNMISVGVDIRRLALMVVNGQPKAVSEYIQATSRVGRDRVPGLVLTVFNNGKPRDRSHYESFASWHATLYRDVEPTSVTPFASRALDKALRGVLVAMVRHLVPSMAASPVLQPSSRPEVERIASMIIDRAAKVDPAERPEVERKVLVALDEWEKRQGLTAYWDESSPQHSLVISAEQRAALRAVSNPAANTWAAPNSMRDVEPGTKFRMVE